MNTSLATQYRPESLDEIVGQDITIKILKQQLNNGYIPHTLIFEGPSGTGKTTTARAFAKALNNGPSGIIEIDAASNNGVDNVRNIIKEAQSRSLYSTYKVFIIDECHSLSIQGWQSFLKCIEEPPKYSIFIFCTTEIDKVPDTIKNRCQLMHLNRIDTNTIFNRLKYICVEEHVSNYEESISYIAKISEGQMRTAISYLEKCISNGALDIKSTMEALNRVNLNDLFIFINAVIDDKEDIIYNYIDTFYEKGVNFYSLTDQLINTCLDIQKYILFKDLNCTNIPFSYINEVKNSINFEGNSEYYMNMINCLYRFKIESKLDTNKKDGLTITLLKVARGIK